MFVCFCADPFAELCVQESELGDQNEAVGHSTRYHWISCENCSRIAYRVPRSKFSCVVDGVSFVFNYHMDIVHSMIQTKRICSVPEGKMILMFNLLTSVLILLWCFST